MCLGSELPDDIILAILSRSVMYSNIFNSSLTMGPQSVWSRALRHKNSIVLVCKQWNILATPLLYREVTLRRFGQLKPFLWTLSNTSNGAHVVEIAISETVYLYPSDLDDFHAELERMLSLLPNATKITVQPSLWIDKQITPVDLRSSFTFKSQSDIIIKFSHKIRSLNVKITASDEAMDDSKPMYFPVLEELRFYICRENESPSLNQDPPLLNPSRWELPVLRSLQIQSEEFGTSSFALILPFVEIHGSNLLQLGIHHPGSSGTRIHHRLLSLLQILERCPNVRHLSLDFFPPYWDHSAPYPVFPKVEMIDVLSLKDQWTLAKDKLKRVSDNPSFFPHVKFITFVSNFPFETFFLPPLPSQFDVIHVFQEAWSWFKLDGSNISYDETDPDTSSTVEDGSCRLRVLYGAPADPDFLDKWLVEEGYPESAHDYADQIDGWRSDSSGSSSGAYSMYSDDCSGSDISETEVHELRYA